LFSAAEGNNYIKLLEGEILELSDMQNAKLKEKTVSQLRLVSQNIKQLGCDLSRHNAVEWNEFMTAAIGQE
jgi:hypothetical protein